MALPATSPMVVDLSGDNDNAGALAAAASIPTVSPDAAFERSCDNPECSAPKLISLVPKKETPEFITEPVIMNQPTLINGFTTVFQIDGTGARINDIIYGENSDAGTSNSATTPRSVFRIVPNTHAHIVNYVVVDGAGETMRKIKANDADTMRKLLDSQRLSAEQMLKKLIGKAFIKPTAPRQMEQSVPLPISCKIQTPKSVAMALPNVVPVSGFKLAAGTVVKPVLTASQEKVLPPVPSGITITQIPAVIPPKTTHIPTNIDMPNVSAPVLRNALISPQTETDKDLGRSTALKRKLTTTPQPDVIKKLRSRSPKQKTPLAVGLQLPLSVSTPAIKLPTVAKLPTKASTTVSPLVQMTPLTKKLIDGSSILGAHVTSTFNKNKATVENDDSIDASSATIVNQTADTASISTGTKGVLSSLSSLAASASFNEGLPVATPKSVNSSFLQCDETMSTKPKPLMGPASKMNALKALTAAKESAAQIAEKTKIGADLTSKISIAKIGDIFITSSPTATPRTDAKAFPNIKPCTVSIPKVDVPVRIKITDFMQKVNASKIDAGSAPNPHVTKLTPGTTKTDAKLSSAETSQPAADTSTVDEDPLFIGERISLTKASVAPGPKADAKPMTRASFPMLSKTVELNYKATKISPKPPTLSTMGQKSDARLLTQLNSTASKSITTPQSEIAHMKMTRASTPKVSAPLPTKPAGPLPTKPAGPLPTKPAGQIPTKLIVKLPTRPAAVLPTRLSAQANKSATPGDTSASSSLQSKFSVATRKSGVMTIPITSAHPNLKISSVISGGSAVAATLGDNSNSSDIIVNEDNGGPNIEKLQQELADLRRTVARLTKKKP